MEFWTPTFATPTLSADFARRAEAVGWDGMLVVDSQNLWGDPYVCLALAGAVTERLGLATSVTNPVTRYPAATASSALSLQGSSGGRMVLGIGRGDSARTLGARAGAPRLVRALQQAAVFRDLHDHYDMNYHAKADGPQTSVLTEEFIDGYGIVGGPDRCAARLEELVELGIEKFAVMGPNFSAPLPEAREAAARFTEEVIPRLRG